MAVLTDLVGGQCGRFFRPAVFRLENADEYDY
jgi:hypothetical protein